MVPTVTDGVLDHGSIDMTLLRTYPCAATTPTPAR